MSIALSDIPDAVETYLSSDVITTVSPVVPNGAKQTVLTPNSKGNFTFSATNGDAAKGVRLVDVVYHVFVGDDTVLQLLAPGNNGSGLVLGYSDVACTKVIIADTKVSEMYVQLSQHPTLDAGEVGPTVHLDVHCSKHGSTDVTVHVHGAPDLESLFPQKHSNSVDRSVDVI